MGKDDGIQMYNDSSLLKIIYASTLAIVSGCSSVPELNTNTEGIYFIKTSLCVEVMTTPNSKYQSYSLGDIKKELNAAENIFKDLNIRFVISDINYFEYNPAIDQYTLLIKHSPENHDSLVVTYVFPRHNNNEHGRSSFPWNQDSYSGIVMTPSVLNVGARMIGPSIYNFAHEFGHFLGLIHTFAEDDLVEDTITNEPLDNYHNVMSYNYGLNDDQIFVTEGQIIRMRYFLEAERSTVLITRDEAESEYQNGLNN